MKDKKGVTMMLKVILGIVLAVISIGLLFAAASKMFSLFFSGQGKLQANGQLDKIIELADGLKDGQSVSTVLMSPRGWWLIGIPKELNEYNGAKKPGLLFGKNVLCVCPKKKLGGINCVKGICKEISLPFVSSEKGKEINLLIQIQVKNIIIKNSIDRFILSESELTVKPKKLTDTESDIFKDAKEIIESKYSDIIDNTLKECNIDRKLLIAIIYQESKGNQYAIGSSGEIGLMQLMPFTAAGSGLSIYNNEYETYDGYSKASKEEIKQYVNNLKNIVEEYKQQNKLDELPSVDDRFNESKNIMAGCKHIKAMLDNNNGHTSAALAAYNWGQGNVNKNCNDEKTVCNFPTQVENYVSSVEGYMNA